MLTYLEGRHETLLLQMDDDITVKLSTAKQLKMGNNDTTKPEDYQSIPIMHKGRRVILSLVLLLTFG